MPNLCALIYWLKILLMPYNLSFQQQWNGRDKEDYNQDDVIKNKLIQMLILPYYLYEPIAIKKA